MNGKQQADKKFQTQDKKILKIWDEIQCNQTDFCFAQEVSAYYMSENWVRQAKTVLDVGTGNGYFLNKLMDHFPDRQYIGIDISKEFIEIARTKLSHRRVELRVDDFFQVNDVYDFIIMRLFWQHISLSRFEEALEKLSRLTVPGSSVLISDAMDNLRCFVPELTEFRKVISKYSQQQSDANRDRNIVNKLVGWAQNSDSWELGSDVQLIFPSSIPGNLKLFRRVYELWIELFECLGEIDMDFSKAKKEIGRWQSMDNAYTQAGLRVIRLDRLG